MKFFADMIKARAAAQPFKPNMAARLYAAIGGTAATQAAAITLGYEPQEKPRPARSSPAGSKRHNVARHLVGGQAFTMPHRPFRHGKILAR